jgi:hypothetical protein
MTAKGNPKRAWTPEEEDRLRNLYATHTARRIGEMLGRSKSSIKNRINKLGITSGKNPGRFAPGAAPWNKGIAFNAGGRSAETRFKPGHLSGRAQKIAKPIGHERLSKDGYLERKISEDPVFRRRWRAVHILLWEAAHGPLPKGHTIVFKDGNKRNIALDNLQLVTRAELMARNTMHNYGPEIARVIQLKGAITRQINRRTRHEQHR